MRLLYRRAEACGVRSVAVFSRCETYRYRLSRRWGTGGVLAVVMLNPSTADHRRNDPTIARCVRRARASGFGGVDIVNLFAFRATDPRDLKRAQAPIGPSNDRIVMRSCGRAAAVLCAWGVHGAFLERDHQILKRLKRANIPLAHIGLTATGAPRHPLYVAKAVPLTPWVG